MRYIARGLALAAATTLVLVAAPSVSTAGAAQSGTKGTQETQSLYAPSALVLTVTAGDDAANGTVLRAVTLGCAPRATGTHPAAAEACAELRANEARFDAITTRGSNAACTKQWDPVTVTADGVWEGKRVSYVHTFGNACTKGHGSGVVFGF
ncbi:subtilase-type protease inhibitor [Streptomyces sp. NPDC002889]|uniref:subtilase-type protease inhibitor n=1 Tax=Streptomyces sp. NPDC002889 TaxID=3364669 RepID=UPI00368C0D69